jgi:RWD domain
MEYETEQAQELEILTSIYDEEEFEGKRFLIRNITFRNLSDWISDTGDSWHGQTRSWYFSYGAFLTSAHFLLHVILPPTYPEVIPELSLSLTSTSPRSTIPKDQFGGIVEKLNVAAEENLGMAMIYTLVSILKETLEELLLSNEAKEKENVRLAEEKEKLLAQDEFESQIRGLRRTPVTYELFVEWKTKFNEWKKEQKRTGNDIENVRGRNREKERREEVRLSGREVFERLKAEAEEGFEEGEEDGLIEREDGDDSEEPQNVAAQVGMLKVEG